MDFLEIDSNYAGTPVSVNIDTDIDGVVILARLCQFANDIDMGEGYDMSDIYSQLIVQLESYGNVINNDEPTE
jgi:hypothetical protein